MPPSLIDLLSGDNHHLSISWLLTLSNYATIVGYLDNLKSVLVWFFECPCYYFSMLDIRFIRENPDLIKTAVKKRHRDFSVDDLLSAERDRVSLLQGVEALRQEQNAVGANVAGASASEREALLAKLSLIKEQLQKKEKLLTAALATWQRLMLTLPNVPDMSVPEGKGEEENVEEKSWGERPEFSFTAKDHLYLHWKEALIQQMTTNGMVDFERGVKAHGFRGYFLRGAGATLSWAIWNYARDFFENRGFEPFIAPAILKKQHFYGTGHLPGDADDLYKTQDDDYLSGTSEVAMMVYHAEEILQQTDLPKRYLAFSPCYRREAGSHGKDTRGLIRVHEFYKLEQLVLCEASHELSVKIHEELTTNHEQFIESLGLPYHRLVICTGDLKTAQVKSYDTELWIPSEGRYREIASASYYHDFQTRRFNIRYEDAAGKKHYAHSLNATAVPTPRILVALVEHYQQADGSIVVPPVLQPYARLEVIRPR